MDMNWKRFERKVAEISGGKRIPVNGRKELDVKHPHLGIECKYRKHLPKWLFKHAWGQAVSGSDPSQIPVVCVGQYHHSTTFAILELDHLIELLSDSVKFRVAHTWATTEETNENWNFGGTDPD